jgi:putative ABC transport system permease protein
VLGEALLVGVLASVAGAALGAALARPFARWLARANIAPASFTARFILWPLLAAVGVGLLVALLGAALAARRAARIRPVEALREAAVDRRPMTLSRWLVGLAALGGSVPLIMVFASLGSADAVALFAPIAMLLVTGFAMLAPVVIPPLTRLGTAPLAAAGVGMLLARHSTLTAVRRTAAAAAPILATAGIAGGILTGFDTVFGTQQAAAHSRVAAAAVVIPDGGRGLADRTVAELRGSPGVSAAVPVSETPVYLPGSDMPDEWNGRYLPGPDLPGVLRMPVVAGDLADLTGTDTVAVPAGRWRLGDRMSLWLADSTPVTLRVVAVLANQLDTDQTVLLPWALRAGHTARPLADAVYLGLAPGVPPGGALAAVAADGGGRLAPTSGYLSAADAEQNRLNRLALTAILGLSLTYTAISIANTLIMATGERSRELATLRLSGATPAQVLRMISVEAVLVTGVGLLLAGGVTAVIAVALLHGLPSAAPVVRLVVPVVPLAGIGLACLLIALLASLGPAALLLRRPPVELAGVRE